MPLFFALLPNDAARVAAQLIVSAITWTALVLLLATFLPAGWQKIAFLVLGSALASSPAVLQWETVVLAQTLHTVLVVVALASIVLVFRRPVTWLHAGLFTAALGLLSFTKVTHLPLVALLAAVFLMSARSLKTPKSILWLVGLGSISCIVLAIPVLNNVDRSWDLTYSGSNALYALGSQDPSSAGFKDFVESRGGPACITRTAPYENWEKDVELAIRQGCPEAHHFIRNELPGLLLEYRLTRPLTTLRVGATGLAASMVTNGLRYGPSVSLVPESVASIVFGKSDPDVLTFGASDQLEISRAALSGDGFWVYAPQFAWLLLGILALSAIGRRSAQYGDRGLALCLLVVILGLLLESFGSLILLSSEWTRLVSPYINPGLLAVIFACALYASNRSTRMKEQA